MEKFGYRDRITKTQKKLPKYQRPKGPSQPTVAVIFQLLSMKQCSKMTFVCEEKITVTELPRLLAADF